jgi:hypothetical protein
MLLLIYALDFSLQLLLEILYCIVCENVYYCSIDTSLYRYTNGCVGTHNHACRHHTLSTQWEYKTHTTYSQAKHTTGTLIQDCRKISQQKNAASSHIGEHQKSDNTRHKGHEQRKEKYIFILVPNSIKFNFNYNIFIFNTFCNRSNTKAVYLNNTLSLCKHCIYHLTINTTN